VSLTSTSGSASPLVEGTPIADFEVIWDGRLSTSTAPRDLSQGRWLRGQGVNAIVNLDDRMWDYAQFGFEGFLWAALGSDSVPTDLEAVGFLEFIQVRDNQPAHISSARSDRRALMVALLRYAIDGWSIDSALAEATRLNNGVPLSLGQVQWLLNWAATHLPGSSSVSSRSTDSTLSPTTSTVARTA
jgi:hypothetical protein